MDVSTEMPTFLELNAVCQRQVYVTSYLIGTISASPFKQCHIHTFPTLLKKYRKYSKLLNVIVSFVYALYS